MKISSKKEDYLSKVKTGYRRMKNCRVVICSIVRDCEANLKKNIPVIEELMTCFDEAHVVVWENDSVDGTNELLGKWSQNNPNVHIISEDLGLVTLPQDSGQVIRWFSRHRIDLMASYRNKYLDFIEQADWTFDYVITVDLDLARIYLDGIANSFGQVVKWDVIASNGKAFSLTGTIYYDTYAYVHIGEILPKTLATIYTDQILLSGLKVGTPLIPVVSGFGGLAIYTAEAIRGVRYQSAPNDDPQVEVSVEHVALHKAIRDNGYNLIFINPSQVVLYDTFLPVLIMRLKGFMKKLLSAILPQSAAKGNGQAD